MEFSVNGPFLLPRTDDGVFTREARDKRAFWEEVEVKCERLPEACGCYLFSIRNRIWYVGKASSQSFRQECFTPDKVTKIDDAIRLGKGECYLTLIARKTPSGKFCKPGGFNDIDQLELMLIGAGLERNKELLNKHATAVLRDMVVPGFINSPRGAGNALSVLAFRKIMGI